MAGIYYEGQLRMNEYTLKTYMMTNTEDPEDHNIALNRIKQFIFNELESTIFISSSEVEQCQKLATAGLNITTMPGEPVDQLIGIMLFSKLSAITEERLLIVEIEISSMLSDGIVYLHGENENVNDIEIPSWWTTSDLVHCEQDLIDTEKVVTMHKSSVWRELDLGWPDNEDDATDTLVDENGNTVVFADFKKLDDTK
jgi:hypothetical protein